MIENEKADLKIKEEAELELFEKHGHVVRRVWDTEKAYEVFVMFVLLACETIRAQKHN